jgi:hypothetical protein
MIMRRTEKNKENNISYFPSSIKLVLVVALAGVLVWALASVTVSFGWVVALLAFYLLFRLIWTIVKLVIKLVFSILLLSILISLISMSHKLYYIFNIIKLLTINDLKFKII